MARSSALAVEEGLYVNKAIEGLEADDQQTCRFLPKPTGSAYVDRLIYRCIHFHGSRLREPLGAAVKYLWDIERANGEPPFVLSLQHQYSCEDDQSQLAWQVTLVIGVTENVVLLLSAEAED